MIYKIDLNYIDCDEAESYGFIYQDMKCTILEKYGDGACVKLLPNFSSEIKKFNKKNHTNWTSSPIIPISCLIHSSISILTNE